MNDAKEKCDQILAELHKCYGKGRGMLLSLNLMDQEYKDYLVAHSKSVYGKSATNLLIDEEILPTRFKFDQALLDPINYRSTYQGKKIRIAYHTRTMLENLIAIINGLQNGEFVDYGHLNNPLPVMVKPDDVDTYFNEVYDDNTIVPYINTEDFRNNIRQMDLELGMEKLKDFLNMCLKFRDHEELEKMIVNAPTKKDGTFYIRKKVIIAKSGVSLDGQIYILLMYNKDSNYVEFKIKKVASYDKGYRSLEDVPEAKSFL